MARSGGAKAVISSCPTGNYMPVRFGVLPKNASTGLRGGLNCKTPWCPAARRWAAVGMRVTMGGGALT